MKVPDDLVRHQVGIVFVVMHSISHELVGTDKNLIIDPLLDDLFKSSWKKANW